jgi:hypothetical protein
MWNFIHVHKSRILNICGGEIWKHFLLWSVIKTIGWCQVQVSLKVCFIIVYVSCAWWKLNTLISVRSVLKEPLPVTCHIWELKKIVNWVIRYSLLATLSAKFKSSLKRIIDKYSTSPKVEYAYINLKNGKNLSGTLASYPTKKFFNHKKKEFAKSFLPFTECLHFLKAEVGPLNVVSVVRGKCVVVVCRNNSQEIYSIKKLSRRLRVVFYSSFNSTLLQGWKVIELVLSRKQVFLCKNCYRKIYFGEIFENDFDLKFALLIEGKL